MWETTLERKVHSCRRESDLVCKKGYTIIFKMLSFQHTQINPLSGSRSCGHKSVQFFHEIVVSPLLFFLWIRLPVNIAMWLQFELV